MFSFNYNDIFFIRDIRNILSVQRVDETLVIRYSNEKLQDDIITFSNNEEALEAYKELMKHFS